MSVDNLKVYNSTFSKKHNTGDEHPENPKRIETIETLLNEPEFSSLEQVNCSPTDIEQIFYAHNEDYVFDLQDKTPDHGLTAIDGDTILSPASFDAALYAAGACIQAVDDICTPSETSEEGNNTDSPSRLRAWRHSKTQKAFCLIRPPGHHAEPNTAMGFCLFNNVFIAARHAQMAHNIKKIAIIDFDVHHGNGTETMTRHHNAQYPDQPIFYISTHGYPLFPMTGDPANNDETTLNIRLPENCDSKEFRTIYENQVFPALHQFKPELIMLSSGFDAHRLDPLAPINLETADYGWLTGKLCDIADQHCQGRIISVLEGGYHLEALRDSVRAHLLGMMHNLD
jgi:acetoin utilization deacetylase AcuC-like enzyme